MPFFDSLGDLHETNRKLFIQIEAKIQQNDVFISVEKNSWEPPYFFHWSTNDKQQTLS